jgi:hypothetical protein
VHCIAWLLPVFNQYRTLNFHHYNQNVSNLIEGGQCMAQVELFRPGHHHLQQQHLCRTARAVEGTTYRSLRRPCCGLVCRAVLNLEPLTAKNQTPHQRDVTTQALAAEAALLPLPVASVKAAAALIAESVPLVSPDQGEQQQGQRSKRSVLWQVLDNGVMVPVRMYQQAMSAHPLSTKACTALVGFVLGDVIAQVGCS